MYEARRLSSIRRVTLTKKLYKFDSRPLIVEGMVVTISRFGRMAIFSPYDIIAE